MPWAEGTLTDADVATELGIPTDARVTVATDAARAWAQDRVTLDPSALWSHPARHRGGVLYGCYQYLQRAAPGGQASYEDAAYDTWGLRQEAERLIPADPVTA